MFVGRARDYVCVTVLSIVKILYYSTLVSVGNTLTLSCESLLVPGIHYEHVWVLVASLLLIPVVNYSTWRELIANGFAAT